MNVVFTALWLVTPSLLAGIRIVESQQPVFYSGGDKILRIAIDGERVAVEITQGDSHRATILRGDLGVLWLVDYKEKIYREITRDLIDKVQDRRSETTSAAKARVTEQLQTLTPEQRRDLEAIMQAAAARSSFACGSSTRCLKAPRSHRFTGARCTRRPAPAASTT
jgi:hypothetical protein